MKKQLIYLCLALAVTVCIASCNKQSGPLAGEWQGEGISFTVCETRDTITELNVVVPFGEEFFAQMYYSLEIKKSNFASYRDGVPYLGIPEANLEGNFISRKLAKGTFNGIEWNAKPVSKKEK